MKFKEETLKEATEDLARDERIFAEKVDSDGLNFLHEVLEGSALCDSFTEVKLIAS